MKRDDNKEVKLTHHNDGTLPRVKPEKEIWTHITEIDSTNVKELLYNKKNTLIVEFHHGGKYHYSDVKPVEFEAILKAASIGKALREYTADSKPYYKITE